MTIIYHVFIGWNDMETSGPGGLLEDDFVKEVKISIEIVGICFLGLLSVFIWGSGNFFDFPGLESPLLRGGFLMLILTATLKAMPVNQ